MCHLVATYIKPALCDLHILKPIRVMLCVRVEGVTTIVVTVVIVVVKVTGLMGVVRESPKSVWFRSLLKNLDLRRSVVVSVVLWSLVVGTEA